MKMELIRLDELWNVLDQCAARVWPGWTGFADVPFLFDYENGVRNALSGTRSRHPVLSWFRG